jgi:hypothetical protein
MSGAGLPITCQMCGNDFPDKDAVWDHECPAWEIEVRQSRPRLAVYRNIQTAFEEISEHWPWRKRLLDWGLRRVFPDDPDADILDALGKLGPRHARRLEARLIKSGVVKDEGRTPLQTIRRRLDLDDQAQVREMETEMAVIVAESKRRRRAARK